MSSNRTGSDVPAKRSKLARVPLAGDVLALTRLLRDTEAPLWTKLLVGAAFAYVLWPIDAVPDMAPLVTWLDDMGVLVVMRLLLSRRLKRYRYPVGQPSPLATTEV